MRNFLIAGAVLLAAVPAFAQPVDHDERRDEAAVDARDLAAAAGTLDRLVGAVMDLEIGGIVAAVDPLGRSGYRRGDTVRDVATRDDPHAERRLRAGIRGTTRTIGVMGEALARLIPVLEHSIEEVRYDVERAIDEARVEPR